MLPEPVRRLTTVYLERVDAALPGLVKGCYLVGSVALNDFEPRVSDVDFITVTTTSIEERLLDSLAEVHASLGDDMELPAFEGPYVTFAELKASPSEATGAFHHEGKLQVITSAGMLAA